MKRFILYSFLIFNFFLAQAQTSVGIGTNTPNSKSLLDVSSISKGLLTPRMTTAQRMAISAITNPPTPTGLLVYDTDFEEFFYYSNNNLWQRLLTNIIWNRHPTRNFIYSNGDSVGIGVSSLSERFQVGNGSIFVQDNRPNKNPHIIFDVPAVDYNEGGMQWKRNGDTLAAINYVEDPNVANYIKIASGGAGKGNDLTINTNGEVAIGTTNPLGQLHLAPYTGDNLVIRDAEGTIQFIKPANTLGGSDEKKGFLQLTDTDDLRLGTNSNNNLGKFIIRTNGSDRMTVDQDGEVGIGTPSPLSKLHIVGGEDAGLSSLSNGYILLGPTSPSNPTNLLIDNNEIMVRDGYGAGTLTLQNDGGQVSIGARTTFNVDGEAIKLTGANPNIGFYQGSTYRSFISQSGNNLFIGVNGGKLQLDATQIAIGAVSNAGTAYKLTVSGKIICEEVRVQNYAAWPDYVFAPNYQLKSLPELKQYIQTNNHLPGIPTAAQVQTSGIAIGDMQQRMMEKIEELTLYILQQQEQINELNRKERK